MMLEDVDRSLCAWPVLASVGIRPCAQAAVVVAQKESGFFWAYCPAHGQAELARLRVEIRAKTMNLGEAWMAHQKLDALLISIELA